MIPGLGRSPGKGNGYPLQYSGLEIPWTIQSMVSESDTTERLSLSLASSDEADNRLSTQGGEEV